MSLTRALFACYRSDAIDSGDVELTEAAWIWRHRKNYEHEDRESGDRQRTWLGEQGAVEAIERTSCQ